MSPYQHGREGTDIVIRTDPDGMVWSVPIVVNGQSIAPADPAGQDGRLLAEFLAAGGEVLPADPPPEPEPDPLSEALALINEMIAPIDFAGETASAELAAVVMAQNEILRLFAVRGA